MTPSRSVDPATRAVRPARRAPSAASAGARRSRALLRAPVVALLGAALGASACSGARPEATLAATRADGRVVSLDSTTSTFEVGGVRVIHRANFATEVVAANVYLLGGTRQLAPATQGIEALVLLAGEHGTAGHPGPAWRAAWGATGSDLSIDPGPDWTRVGFRAIRTEFDASWDALADRLMRPTLGERAVARARARLVARVRQRRADPSTLVWLLADSVAHAGHPYALRPEGTEASLLALDSAALARYHASQMVGTRLLVVVVGGVERATVEAAVARTLARLPRGTYAWSLPPAPPRASDAAEAAVAFVHRPAAATNFVLGLFPGPDASSAEAPAFQLATAFLASRVGHAVREQGGLSYSASAPHFDRAVRAGSVYLSTSAPRLALPLVRAQCDSLRRATYPPDLMRFFVRQFVTEYIAEHLTSAAQADRLARAALYLGDHRRASAEMEMLRHVSGLAVQQAARRYVLRPRFVFVGDTTLVSRAAFAGF